MNMHTHKTPVLLIVALLAMTVLITLACSFSNVIEERVARLRGKSLGEILGSPEAPAEATVSTPAVPPAAEV